MSSEASSSPVPVTLSALRKMAAGGQAIPVLTCYDATTARWLDRAGIPVLLVGDTAGPMMLGEPSTIFAPLDFMLTITAAVKRAAERCFVMGDMPFMSYQADRVEAIRNAGRFMTEGRADAVKLEVDGGQVDLVRDLSRAGVPVVAHLGLRPQRVACEAGYHVAGKTALEARALVEQAERFEEAGAVMLLIEATPAEVSRRIVQKVRLPVIGCGAGPDCHGHVVVLHDLLGLTDWQPSFARPMASVGQAIRQAAEAWATQVRNKAYLRRDHPYVMDEREKDEFLRG
jgi:3-methyl-2-oxobutanoate hydroxymethyltransferase